MNRFLQQETERLRWSWDKYSREYLDQYLVSEVEDPRINIQSILTRSLIADTLFPGEFADLINREWQFSVCMQWLMQALGRGHVPSALLQRIEAIDHSFCPEFVCVAYDYLQQSDCPIPNYLSVALTESSCDRYALLPERSLNTFQRIWMDILATRTTSPLSIIEPACGSANDYRYLNAYGFAPLLAYSGFDLAEKNIANAQNRFPKTSFFVGNIFQIPMADASSDYLFVHDLFEHLSPYALEVALDEVLRVTKKEAWLSFFNLDEIPDHRFQSVDAYYCNTLSLDRLLQFLDPKVNQIEVVDISSLIQKKFGVADYYNPLAKTLLIEC